jgi:anionic cell wall polymer biosynthesis LytR-Cps2A-Psr (LCP) family protein
MGGVNVNVPYPTTSFGFTFHAGINHLTGASALAYVRQPAVSEVGRMQLQENLFRVILRKIASRGFFVGTDFHVLNAVVAAVSVDSTFTNSQLESLALSLGHLQGSDGLSIDVPTTGSPRMGGTAPVFLVHRVAQKLWQAIRHDIVTLFALGHPSTITPGAPG